MKTILVVLCILAILQVYGVAAVTFSGPQTRTSTVSTCSSSSMNGGLVLTVCASKSTYHINQPATITMTATNTSPGNAFFYTMSLNILNNGATVFSASQACPSQFSCPVASGQTLTVTFSWTATQPRGSDIIQGTLIWDVGCRIFGCLVVSPPPVITQVTVAIK